MQYSTRHAEATLTKIRNKIIFLMSYPKAGNTKNDDDFREIVVTGTIYKIFYRIIANNIEITHIFNMKQNPEKIRGFTGRHLEHDA